MPAHSDICPSTENHNLIHITIKHMTDVYEYKIMIYLKHVCQKYKIFSFIFFTLKGFFIMCYYSNCTAMYSVVTKTPLLTGDFWSEGILLIKAQGAWLYCLSKLDGVGPIDNSHSADKLNKFVQKNKPCIQEILNHSTNADSSTKIFFPLASTKGRQIFFLHSPLPPLPNPPRRHC